MQKPKPAKEQNTSIKKLEAENKVLRDVIHQRVLDLDQKKKELDLESSLDRVRTIAMKMRKPNDLLDICTMLFTELRKMDFAEIRNTMINIYDDVNKSFINYDYSEEIGKSINHLFYNIHPVIEKQVKQIRKSGDAFSETSFIGKDLKDWKTFRKKIGEKDDPRIEKCKGLYYYFYSIGTGAIGISTFEEISEEKKNVLHRFRNVFDLSYQRYTDIAKAEAQVREAQIEAAMERVRSSSLGMHRSDELQGVVNTVIEQLKELNIELDTTNILIFHNELKSIEFWTGSNSTGKQLTSGWQVSYTDNTILKEIHQAQQNGLEVFFQYLPFKEKNKFFDYLFTNTDFKNLNVERKKFIFESERASILRALVKDIAIQIISYSRESFLPEEIEILKRFAKVFEQAYTRFLDLQKAEAQAREAQIETALERVRSRSMGMQQSEELKEVIKIVYKQLALLKIKLDHAGFVVDYTPGGDWHFWIADEQDTPSKITHPYFESVWANQFNEAKAKGEDFFVTHLNFEEKNKFYNELLSYIPDLPKATKDFYLNCPALTVSTVLLDNIGLYIENFSGTLYTDEENTTLLRFGKVFQQTYTRFLDLQKAESQARESQIEAALERVRSRSIGMQKSIELSEVVHLLDREISGLGINVHSTSIITDFAEKEKGLNNWIAILGINYLQKFHIPYNDNQITRKYLDAISNGIDFYTEKYDKAEKDTYFKWLYNYSDFIKMPEERKQFIYSTPGWVRAVCICKNSILIFQRHSLEEYTEAEHSIFKRFGKVFEQSYTRFLDLQKAETQAREAQIELGLERVRARAMAMQKSDELKDLIATVSLELSKLDLILYRCFIIIYDTHTNDSTWWTANPETPSESIGLFVKYHNHPPYLAQLKAWKDRIIKWQYILEGETKKTWDKFLFIETDFSKLPEVVSANMIAKEKIYLSNSYNNFGCLALATLESLSEEQFDIMLRFAKVFDLTYTRFNDLQKAEAQARESQIQLAMERVRARTMAMQRSEELPEVAALLFQQVKTLGVPQFHCGFNIFEIDDKECTWYPGSADGDILPPCKIPLTEHPVFMAFNESRKRGDELFVYEKEGEYQAGHYRYMLSLPVLGEILQNMLDAGIPFPTFQIDHLANFSHGNLLFITSEHFPEMHDTFKRFAKVFEQTYTRFLDLQKAETQARESQIELGLERVRARAMAMQRSSELSELVDTVFKELTKLDFALTWCIINIIDESSMSNTVWAANPDINKAPESYHMLFEDYPFHDAMMKGWKERKTKTVYTLEGDEKRIYDDYLFNETEFRRTPEAAQTASRAMEKYVVSFSFSNFGGLQTVGDVPLSDANLDILSRFGKVFDLTYTRFNDLKQAEAQARESQIQLALERVRARTMAMQRSDELKDAAALLFQQVKSLGAPAYSCGYNIWEKNEKEFTSWMSTQDGSIINGVPNIPLTEDANFIRYVESKENGELFFVLELRGERMQEHYEYLKTIPAFKAYFDYAVSVGFDLPETQIHHLANFSNGNLLFITLEPCPEFHDVFKRFAAVFEQTYTRFLDLQKAEAQVREAMIETALEKVRSRSLVMRISTEINEVVKVLYHQFETLGIGLYGEKTITIVTFDENKRNLICFIAGPEFPEVLSTFIPYTEHTIISDVWKAKEQGLDYFSKVYSFEEKNSYWHWAFEHTNNKFLPDQVKKMLLNSDNYASSLAFAKHSGIYFPGYHGLVPIEKDVELIVRFANVFDQAYTRFLDLQKAEAQARESQIELALERVRARTMAMQHSVELQDTSLILFEQLKELGEPAEQCTIGIIKESEGVVEISATLHGNKMQQTFRHKLDEPFVMTKMFKGWKDQQRTLVLEIKDEELQKYNQYRNELVGKETFQVKLLPSDRWIIHIAYFSKGMLALSTNEPRPAESLQLLERFAIVFEQTYTRFLDLQKAEAQARESQIQLAMERVRARTMAMQKSDELTDVAGLLFEQVSALGIKTWTAGFNVWSEDNNSYVDYIRSPQGGFIEPYTVFTEKAEALTDISNARKSGVEFDVQYVEGEKIKQLYLALTKLDEKQYEIMLQDGVRFPSHQYEHFVFGSKVSLMFITYEPVQEAHDIFKRLGKVFEQTYTRFLDLQKAEAQARESQIQLALERVRARTMAMQKSDELPETSYLLFQQVKELGETTVQNSIGIVNEAAGFVELSTTVQGHHLPHTLHVPIDDPYVMAKAVAAWKAKHKSLKLEFTGQELKNYNEHRNSFFETKVNFPEDQWNVTIIFFSKGWLSFSSNKNISDEMFELLKRFAAVFEQTYTRFNDLKQAEVQAREAHIEAALERVRSKTMAMHNSQDVGNTVATMFDQLMHLGVTTNRCGILIFSDTNNTEVWTAKSNTTGEATLIIGMLDVTIHPMLQGVRHAWAHKEPFFSYELAGEDIWSYYSAINNSRDYPTRFNLDTLPAKEIHSDFFFPEGAVFAFTSAPLAADDALIFKRFAGVFGQTYRRYLDLLKAEAQTKEAKIEASLERVRSKAMAMHNSQDLSDTIGVFYRELLSFSITPRRCGIGIMDKKSRMGELFTWNTTERGEALELIGHLKMDGHPVLNNIYDYWINQEEYHPVLRGNEIKEYYKFLRPQMAFPEYQHDDAQYGYFFFFKEGGVYAWTEKEMKEDELQIYRRFTTVLSLTYKRYKDLKQAEEQTRRAQIETAMEKVRARALAMQKPEELIEVAEVLRKEMGLLGVEELETSSIYIHNEALENTECWYAIKKIQDDETKLVTDHMIMSLKDTWVGHQMLDFYYSDKKQISIPMQGEHRKEWINYCAQQSKVLEGFYGENIPDRTYHLNKFSNGYIGAASPGAISTESWDLLQRATAVFSLAYTRFNDLQIAEASTKEAVRRASLDRVRAEIASMRTTKDLEKITPLIWNELTILTIPFIRCGVFIMDESQELIHTFLSTPDGKAIGAFHLPYTTLGNIQMVLSNWREKRNYIDHWDEAAFIEFATILMKQGAITSPDQYLSSIPHGGIYLHFLPFLQGMLYVGNTIQLEEDEIKLIQSVADAFSTAYARYEDFNKLESAKEQIENTLTTLKLAQAQLIQSEKMASLGELTAGIAHEIQNPLNFVNNFASINTELIDEMKLELSIGNMQSANEIADTIKENEEKINHHGKRAESIVRGMLQHSRKSTATKEPTDINALADEYMRLSYHGLRAKDKSFNADFKMDLDPTLPLVKVIPQDIGRVLLNLFNNAFWACAERGRLEIGNRNLPTRQAGSESSTFDLQSPISDLPFSPSVTLTTKNLGENIEIRVSDNGPGIPPNIIDKIFQPFFTTKPTGQGTGLGLSLAYDIIKAHQGELTVETKGIEGTTFILQLHTN